MRKHGALVSVIIVAGLSVYAAEKPSDILDLSRWKLTLPITRPGEKLPIEIHQPELSDFEKPDYFFANNASSSVVFRAYCTNTTTSNSKYPRCELREMTGHREKAKWSTSDGILHRMTMTQAITAVPPVKKHVVAGQIHDANDDVIMIRLEDRKLFVERNKFGDVVLDRNYELGTKFTVKIDAYDDHIKVSYNDELKMDWEYSNNCCYFKAGCYVQSNTGKGDNPESYGEVIIYNLKVEHIMTSSMHHETS